MDLLDVLNTTAFQKALGNNTMFIPESLQFTQPGMFNQLETYGMASMCRMLISDLSPNKFLYRDSFATFTGLLSHDLFPKQQWRLPWGL